MTDLTRGPKMLIDAAQVCAERGKIYGSMRENMQRTADIWGGILGVTVTPVQVAACLIGLKLARLGASPNHVDSVTDIAGYAAVLRECQDDG